MNWYKKAFSLQVANEILNTAPGNDITQKYRNLVKKYHPDPSFRPDKSPGDENKFYDVATAYNIVKSNQPNKDKLKGNWPGIKENPFSENPFGDNSNLSEDIIQAFKYMYWSDYTLSMLNMNEMTPEDRVQKGIPQLLKVSSWLGKASENVSKVEKTIAVKPIQKMKEFQQSLALFKERKDKALNLLSVAIKEKDPQKWVWDTKRNNYSVSPPRDALHKASSEIMQAKDNISHMMYAINPNNARGWQWEAQSEKWSE